MKKVLMLATVASMIDKFNMNNIFILKSMGYHIDVIANFEFGSVTTQKRVEEFKKELAAEGISVFHVEIPRKITDVSRIIKSYKQVKQICENENYELVHCHSPIGGVIARLACRKLRKKGMKVVYTAHGFHFFKGASLLNWMIYYPVEWICSFYTDVLITINGEDYQFAQKHMHAQKVEYTHGIGVDRQRVVCSRDKVLIREEWEIPAQAKVLSSIGELIKRKNHEIVIRALACLGRDDIYYCIAGLGPLEPELKCLSEKLNMSKYIRFLGYVDNIDSVLAGADAFIFPSLQEGLPVALMEAMAAGLPIVCSKIRGNTDLIKEGKGGFLITDPHNAQEFARGIEKVLNSNLKEQMKSINQDLIKTKFSVEQVEKEMRQIYNEVLLEK